MSRPRKIADDAVITKSITDETKCVPPTQSELDAARENARSRIAEHEASQKQYEELAAEKARLLSIDSLLFDMIKDVVFLLKGSEVENDV